MVKPSTEIEREMQRLVAFRDAFQRFLQAFENIPKRVTARWHVMAGDVHEELPGSLDIDVSVRDWRGAPSNIIAGIRSAEWCVV